MKTRPRLLHVTTTDMSLALLLGPQLEAFADSGYEVLGVSAPGPFVNSVEGHGVRHVPLRYATRAMAPHRDVAAYVELRSLFSRLRPDIVHTHNPKPGVYGRIAARAAGVPAIVNTVHGLYALPEDRWSRRVLVYSLERTAARCSHAELVQNPEDLDILAGLGVSRSKLRLLGNGIDLRRFDPGRVPGERAQALRRQLGVGPETVVCAAVGRLVAEKGLAEVLAAAQILSAQKHDVCMVIAGPDDAGRHGSFPTQAIEREYGNGVRLLGFRPDIETVYAASDIVVLASHREGYPRSAMEAAAMGVPVVATDIRGCRQVVDHGHTGLLVSPRDAEELAGAIARLVADMSLRQRMGAEAIGRARRLFDQRQVIETTLDTYDRLLHRRPLATPVRP